MKRVTVYGAGAAGLMACDVLASHGIAVDLHDHKRTPGRKFLLAGRGGLNLTNAEPFDDLCRRYSTSTNRLEPALRRMPPEAVIKWCNELGVETFVGSSGRVFPRCMKASLLLRALLRRLESRGVVFHPNSSWQGFSNEPAILAFGGASWPELGSDGGWVPTFEQAGIEVKPFTASNARHAVSWSKLLREKFAGTPLKNLRITHGSSSILGEVVITQHGLEGGAIYALSQSVRENPGLPLVIDLRPNLSDEQVLAKMLSTRKGDTRSNQLRKAFGLSPVAIALMRETQAVSIKRLVLQTAGAHDLHRAISSAGGVAWNEIDESLRLRKVPNTRVAGEMIDWDAPTGGYLLQACFSTGRFAATELLKEL